MPRILKQVSADELIDSRSKPVPRQTSPKLYVPSGCSILNLAASGSVHGGWLRGSIVNIIGDSSAGKTFLALTGQAEEASRDTATTIGFDDAEKSNEFDISKLFPPLVGRMLPLAGTVQTPVISEYIHEFYDHAGDFMEKHGRSYIVLDSMDALRDREMEKHLEKARKDGSQGATYGMGKSKANSNRLPGLQSIVEKTDSTVVILSQTRDDINPMTFSQKTRAGGKALKFYSAHELWLAVRQKLKRTVKGVEREIGILTRVKITKNKATGKHFILDIPIYYNYGVDDTRACLEYLLSEGRWKKDKSGMISTGGEFDIHKKAPDVACEIEGMKDGKCKLLEICQNQWDAVEAALAHTDRPPRFQS